jgi:hypothetical protein
MSLSGIHKDVESTCERACLCLKEKWQRIQERLIGIADKMPTTIFFAVSAGTIADDLQKVIGNIWRPRHEKTPGKGNSASQHLKVIKFFTKYIDLQGTLIAILWLVEPPRK